MSQNIEGQAPFGIQNWVGLLLSKHKKDQEKIINVGTGFLIAPDLVLTAAYNIYLLQKQTDCLEQGSVFFCLGASQHFKTSYSYKVSSVRFPEQYKTSNASEKRYFEYALLKLDRKVQNISFVPLTLQYKRQKGDMLSLFGYEINRFSGLFNNYYIAESSQDKEGEGIIQSQIKCLQNFHWKNLDSDLVQHKFPTSLGIGGGPIVAKRQNQLLIVGIHIVLKANKNIRQAKLITEKMISNLIKWTKQMRSSSQNFLIARNVASIRQLSFQSESIVQRDLQKQLVQQVQKELYYELEESRRANIQYQKSNLTLREQIAQLKEIKLKYEILSSRMQQFAGMQNLPFDKIMTKINKLNQLTFQHSIQGLGDTISKIITTEQTLDNILDNLNQN